MARCDGWNLRPAVDAGLRAWMLRSKLACNLLSRNGSQDRTVSNRPDQAVNCQSSSNLGETSPVGWGAVIPSERVKQVRYHIRPQTNTANEAVSIITIIQCCRHRRLLLNAKRMTASAAAGNRGRRSISCDGIYGKVKNSAPNSDADSRILDDNCFMGLGINLKFLRNEIVRNWSLYVVRAKFW